jgi:hypothetical protein
MIPLVPDVGFLDNEESIPVSSCVGTLLISIIVNSVPDAELQIQSRRLAPF